MRSNVYTAFDPATRAANPRIRRASRNVSTFDRILGDSPPLMEVIEQAKTIARGNTTVLILGESGTGKELFAQSIHNASLGHRALLWR